MDNSSEIRSSDQYIRRTYKKREPPPFRQCKACHTIKPIEEFYIHRHKCIICTAKYQLQYRIKVKKKLKKLLDKQKKMNKLNEKPTETKLTEINKDLKEFDFKLSTVFK